MVAAGHNPVAASPAAVLNQIMQWWGGGRGGCGHGNSRGCSTNGGGTSALPPNSGAVPVNHQQAGIGQVGWSVLKEAVAQVGEASTWHELLKRILKGHSDIGWNNSKAKEFRAQALESQNLQFYVGMVRGCTKLKVFHFMVKYNDIFATTNISGSFIGFMGDIPLTGSPGVFKIPWKTNHGHVQSSSTLIMQLKCRTTLDKKGITIPGGIRQ